MMIERVRWTLLLPAVVLIAVAGSAAPRQTPPSADAQATSEAQEPQQPVFRTGINFVRVDVIVTDDDGNLVTDLTADDFEVFEDDAPQTVETFEFFQIGGAAALDAEPPRAIRSAYDEETEAQRPDVRLFAIFMDDYHVRRGPGMRVIEPLVNFVQTQLAPTDMVAIMNPLTPLSEVRLTRNHAAIAEAIRQFRGRKYDYDAENIFEARYSHLPTSTVELIRNDVSLSALRALVTHLGGLREGRKSVILVSEGYTNMLPLQLRNPVASRPGNPLMRNPLLDDLDPRANARRLLGDMSLLGDLQRIFDAANRANTSIYALDPRGLASFAFDIDDGVGFAVDRETLRVTMNTLRELAEATDGRAIVNQNDPSDGLRQAVRDASGYYLIGYTSQDAPTDGRFHEIEVRVNRRDVNVRARKGYWALTPEDVERIESPPEATTPSDVDRALSALEVRRARRTVQTWIGTARGDDGRVRLTFVWRPSPRVPGQRRDEPIRVAVVAGRDRGRQYFEGLVPDLSLVPELASSPDDPVAPAQVTFDVDPGPVSLDLSIRGIGGRVMDTDFLDFVVPDFTGVDTTLSSPIVYRARNAYEMRQLRTRSDAVPETGRDFRRSDQLLIRFETYAPVGVTPTPAARLLNRGGTSMADLPLVAPTTPGEPHALVLPLAGLAPGEYLVEVTASAGDEGTRTLIAFRVTS